MQINKEAQFVLKGNKVVHPPVRTDGLELYYDTKGKKNTDTYKDKLLDMSGNGRHGELHDFNYKNLSGYQEDSELVFDGIDDTLKMPKLSGINPSNFTYQLNNNILAFTGDEVKTVKNGDIEIGGKNYFNNSMSQYNKGAVTSSGNNPIDTELFEESHFNYFRVKKRNSTNLRMSLYNAINLKNIPEFSDLVGREVTISLYVRSNYSRSMQFRFNSIDESVFITFDEVLSTQWKQVSHTFTVTEKTNLVRFTPFTITLRDATEALDFYVDIGGFKLEKGNKATDWTPAPEDLLETTELKGNILGDMEDIIDDHTRDEQSGVEVFTDKADDSLVKVDVDGKSYQHAGSGKNLITNILNDYGSYGGGSTTTKATFQPAGNVSSYLVKVESGNKYTHSHMGSGTQPRWFWFKQHPIENPSEISIGGGYIHNEFRSRILEAPPEANWLFFVVTFNNETHPVWNIQLEEGSTATEYELPAPSPDYPIEIHSLNDFDVVSQKSEGGVIDGIEIGGRNLLQGSSDEWIVLELREGSHYVNIDFRDTILEVGKTYTFSVEVEKVSDDDVPINLHIGTGTTTYQKDIVAWRMNNIPMGERVSLTHTIQEGDLGNHSGIFTYRFRNERRQTTIRYRIQKLEHGTVATDWAPFPEDITESDNHPLIDKINLSLSEPLRSVGDVKDRLFRDSDGLWKIERKIKELIFDGSEAFKWASNPYFSTSNSTVIRNPINNSHFSYNNTPNALGGMVSWGGHPNSNGNMFFGKGEWIDLTEFVDWIKQQYQLGTPLTSQYVLESPTIESLDQEVQNKLNNLRSFEDSNYVYTIINEVDGLPSYISENLRPQIHTEFLAKDHFKESRTVNNLLIWNRSLEDEELLNQNKLFHERFNMKSNTIKGEPITQTINLTQGGYAANTLSLEYTIEI